MIERERKREREKERERVECNLQAVTLLTINELNACAVKEILLNEINLKQLLCLRTI